VCVAVLRNIPEKIRNCSPEGDRGFVGGSGSSRSGFFLNV